MQEQECTRILSTLGTVLPKVPEGTRSYLLGYGDGLAAALAEHERHEEEKERRDA